MKRFHHQIGRIQHPEEFNSQNYNQSPIKNQIIRQSLFLMNQKLQFRLDAFQRQNPLESSSSSFDSSSQPSEESDMRSSDNQFRHQQHQIQSLLSQILPLYYEYRQHAVECGKEICQELQISKSGLTELEISEEEINNKKEFIQKAIGQYLKERPEKSQLAEKMISERRIKRFYEQTHQVGQHQFESHPEQDQQIVYAMYEPAKAQMFENHIHINQDYNWLDPTSQNQTHVVPTIQNQVDFSKMKREIEESFEKMKEEEKKKVNYLKLNDPNIGFEHDLSFDVNQDRVQMNNEMESFGLNENPTKDEINSEIHYDAEKMKRFGKKSQNMLAGQQKQMDTQSHSENIYKNFIEKQNEQLNRQKLRVQELTSKAINVLNNNLVEEIFEMPLVERSTEQLQNENDEWSSLKHLFTEIIHLFCIIESLKYHLKHKSYEIVNKLYENASLYYCESISFSGCASASHMKQVIKAAIPDCPSHDIDLIMSNLFGLKPELTYEDFLESICPVINQKQFKQLQDSIMKKESLKTFELTVRLFSLWIQFDYFEQKIKQTLRDNVQLLERFLSQVCEQQSVNLFLMEEFLFKGQKSKVESLKVELFLKRILGEGLMINEVYAWVDLKASSASNHAKYKEQTYDYYYYMH